MTAYSVAEAKNRLSSLIETSRHVALSRSRVCLRVKARNSIFMQMLIYRSEMAASARLMVLMSPEERASLDAKARALGVSAGEVVRRAVQAFALGTEEEAAELRALVDAFNELHPETLRIADECHRKVVEILAGSSNGGPAAPRRRETAAA